MTFETLQVLAGFASTAIFASSKVPMLVKALRTRDLHSYSIGHIALSASGNLIYWLYVLSLPPGPIWVLQAFFTLADFSMLTCYALFEIRKRRPDASSSLLSAPTASSKSRPFPRSTAAE